MQPSLIVSRLAAAAAAVALAGCTHRGPLTTSEQQSFGTRTFAAPYDVTFQAARDALPRLGYTLQFVDPAHGRITTSRLPIGARAEVGFGGASTTVVSRSYDLRISPVDPHHTRVVAIPHKYAGERDISHQREWRRDGSQGEYANWRELFAAIESGLR